MTKIVEEVPSNDKARKPIAKKEYSLENFKKKVGVADVPDKPLQWIKLSPSMEKATGLPGFAKGYVNLARGYTNTGKSTSICEGIVSAQKMGILPIIIDTENSLGTDRLKLMGFDWKDNHFLIDNEYILENFGKKQDKDRNEAAIEDLAKCIYFFINEQAAGNLPFDLCFAIDSIGTLNCIRTINALEKNDSDNNMWNAGAYEKSFMSMLNNTIPNSRKENKQYTNTLIATQKIWYDSMNKGIKHKGGETFWSGSRLVYHFGGVLTHGTKRVVATSKKRDVAYGIEVKVNVNKNHIDGPLGGISMEGTIVSTPHGFIFPEELDVYKKKNILFFRNLFKTVDTDADNLNVDDIEMKTRNIDANGNVSFEDDFVDKSSEIPESENE
jgi:hypothetical protein